MKLVHIVKFSLGRIKFFSYRGIVKNHNRFNKIRWKENKLMILQFREEEIGKIHTPENLAKSYL